MHTHVYITSSQHTAKTKAKQARALMSTQASRRLQSALYLMLVFFGSQAQRRHADRGVICNDQLLRQLPTGLMWTRTGRNKRCWSPCNNDFMNAITATIKGTELTQTSRNEIEIHS